MFTVLFAITSSIMFELKEKNWTYLNVQICVIISEKILYAQIRRNDSVDVSRATLYPRNTWNGAIFADVLPYVGASVTTRLQIVRIGPAHVPARTHVIARCFFSVSPYARTHTREIIANADVCSRFAGALAGFPFGRSRLFAARIVVGTRRERLDGLKRAQCALTTRW